MLSVYKKFYYTQLLLHIVINVQYNYIILKKSTKQAKIRCALQYKIHSRVFFFYISFFFYFRKFIESLASFRKTLIAGIHGHVVGLGVTILPLFDLVLANANSTFETPYARLGQIPEACSVFLLSNKISHNAVRH